MSLPLADSGIEQWGFVARVGPYEQQQVTVLDAGDAGVQQVVGAQVSAAERARTSETVRILRTPTLVSFRLMNFATTQVDLPCPRHREDLLSAEVF